MFRTVLKQTTKIARCDLAPKVVTRGFAFTYKTSTGLPGLKVDPNGRENLLKLTDEVLDSVKVGIFACQHATFELFLVLL